MTTDLEPGKYTSEKGGFYFACDEGKSVLVGVRGPLPDRCLCGRTKKEHENYQTIPHLGECNEFKPSSYTCPVLGLIRKELPDDKAGTARLIALEEGSETLYGSEESSKIVKVPLNLWIEIFPEEKYLKEEGEWGSGFANSAFEPIENDARPRLSHVIALICNEGDSVIRFHLAYE